jgi:hypothetical protein
MHSVVPEIEKERFITILLNEFQGLIGKTVS